MYIIEAHNLNYETSNDILFDNIDVVIEKGSFVSIVGKNGVGKTTLLKLLGGSIISSNNIKVDNIQVNKFNMEEISRKTSYISSYNEFFSKTVINEILQDKKSVSVFEVNKVKKLLDSFNLLYLENMSPQNLSYAENQIVALIKAIIKKPKIIILDNAFSKLDEDKRKELFDYVRDYAKKNEITVLYTSTDISDIKYSDRIILIKNRKIKFDGTYDMFISDEINYKDFMRLPWETEVSNKLIMYDLLDRNYDSIEDIVGALCK